MSKSWYIREGLEIVVHAKTEKYGAIDKNKKTVVPFNYDWMGVFSGGFAWVKKGDLYGFVDKTGKEITPIKYSKASFFNENLACVSIKDNIGNFLYGFIDGTGKEIIPLIYDWAGDFENGKALVKLDGEHFHIDKENQLVKEVGNGKNN